MLKIESLRKEYRDALALDNVSLSLDSGMVHGLVGKNGSGKTTLFHCVSGLEAHEGQVSFSEGNIKEHVAFLPSAPYMMSFITGAEYLQLIANAKNVPLNANEINIFELPLNKYASSYSTGMKKKLAITGLLLSKHSIFLLDEPFSGVDLESNLLIQQLIAHLKTLGKTIIISSHILESLQHCADMVHVLEDGKLMRSVMPQDYHELKAFLSADGQSIKFNALDL